MTDQQHIENVRKLAVIETKLDAVLQRLEHADETRGHLDRRIAALERKINYYMGGLAVAGLIAGLYLDRIRAILT